MSYTCLACQQKGNFPTFSVKEMMFGTREEFQYFECAACRSVQLSELLPSERIAGYYPADYYSFHKKASDRGAAKLWLYRRRTAHMLGRSDVMGRWFTRMKPDPRLAILAAAGLRYDHRVLDVGCGSGYLLNELAAGGLSNLVGVDPFIDHDLRYDNGVLVHKNTLDGLDESFDFVMFNHSLEHMPDPLEALRSARARLRDGGVCMVRIPTSSSAAYQSYGPDWFQLDAPRHILVPSREGMRIMAEKAGLSLERTIDDSYAASYWASEQYKRGIALRDPRSYSENPAASIFSQEEIQKFARLSDEANRSGKGDQAAFVLRPV